MSFKSPLGQPTVYVETYSPSLLCPIPRQMARDKVNLHSNALPFNGIDWWTGYELSWLNPKGKPEIAIAHFSFPCHSPNVIESKSFKLYLNSFNQSRFESIEQVKEIINNDLSINAGAPVSVWLYPHSYLKGQILEEFEGTCLDTLDVTINQYEADKTLLNSNMHEMANEILYSNLLKSNCLATGQPDWGSIHIHYIGPKIDHEGLLKYIVSFRRHSGFAEHCVEEFFCDIMNQCQPQKLSVYARYTRRGGLDINPFRSNFEEAPSNQRHFRQ